MRKKTWLLIGYNLGVTFIILLIIEASIELYLNNPKYIPNALLENFRAYYKQDDRHIIQYLSRCAKYDSTTYYKLRRGNFKFSNREFETNFKVNSIGVRDDEKSLEKPEIIVLGDSYAMGWGVEQDSTFANRLERKLNTRVLNTGISSYGTAREISLLKSLDTDNLKFLIIQYCSNDYVENKHFFDNNNVLKISSQESYLERCKNHMHKSRYYLFKHILSMFSKKGNQTKKIPENSKSRIDTIIDEPSAFLNALAAGMTSIPLETKVIIFELDRKTHQGRFITELKNNLDENKFAELRKRISLPDVSSFLNESDYFILDDHINSAGHKAVAKRLESLIKPKEHTSNSN